MKSWLVHYMNKYPDGVVEVQERNIIVYCALGKKRVQLWKNGYGMWVDVSAENLCEDRHDLAPIPKESRAWKCFKDGSVGPSEEFKERSEMGRKYAQHQLGGVGKVPSIAECEAYAKQLREQSKPVEAPKMAIEERPAMPVDYLNLSTQQAVVV